MVRKLSLVALVVVALTAQACHKKPQEAGAADAAHALLTAAWSGDAHGFEETLDRQAVRTDLRRQLMAVAQANTLSIEGGASDAALDRMITPDAFRMVQAQTGAPMPAAPTKAQTEALLKPAGKDRACVQAAAPEQTCLLTFAREKTGWRLVGMAPAGFTIAVSPEPAKKSS